MKNNLEIQQIQFAVNHEQEGSSAWIRLAKQEIEINDYEH